MKVSASLSAIAFSLVTCSLLAACTTAGSSFRERSESGSFPPDPSVAPQYQHSQDGILRILTLNVAHGRNQAASQLLLDREQIEQNLAAIAHLLNMSNADLVALQEADGPSFWSGQFDHVQFLAEKAGYPWHYRARHAESWFFSYGTAILSRLPVVETIQHTFKPSPPTFNKGFLLNQIILSDANQPEAGRAIDIVSVHLDFSRKSVRDRQIAEMTEVLANRNEPMIILGDFNSDWLTEESVVRKLAETAGLSVYRNQAKDLYTYNSKQRLDWILISEELVFTMYETLTEPVSDHLAVVADVKFRSSAAPARDRNNQNEKSSPTNGPLSSTMMPESKSVVK